MNARQVVTRHEKHQSREFLLALGLKTFEQAHHWVKRQQPSEEIEKVKRAAAIAFRKTARPS